jgi:hypothetical protein
MCCSHHAGFQYRNHYKKCFNMCENLIRGEKNTKDDDAEDKKNDDKDKDDKKKKDKDDKKKKDKDDKKDEKDEKD